MKMLLLLFLSILSMSCQAKHHDISDCPLPGETPSAPTLKVDFIGDKSLVEFHSIDQNELLLFLSRNDGSRIYVDGISPEGGTPVIESVFTDQADNDIAKELFVLIRWNISHPGLKTEGALFEVRIYDDMAKPKGCGMVRISALERRFGMGFEGRQEGARVHYKYRNAIEIRKRLRTLGYHRQW